MAYCRYNRDIIGSSNLKDIHNYCEAHKITYLTTMDFLHRALNKKILSERECDFFIHKVKYKGSKLPFDTISEYLKIPGE